MDHVTLRPAGVSDAAAAYSRAAATVDEESRRLAASLAPLFATADPAVAQAVHDAATAFHTAFDVVADGHRHAGSALDAAASALVELDRGQAGEP